MEGLKFYLVPNFANFTWKTFADACVQVMFSVGIGWAIFSTLGATLSDGSNIRKDSMMVTICDTCVALTAGFVIIPSVVGAGSEMAAGPSLIFLAMTEIFGSMPGGNIVGFLFFMALIFAVLSTYFTILEIPVKCLEEKNYGNREFDLAGERLLTAVKDMNCDYFVFSNHNSSCHLF